MALGESEASDDDDISHDAPSDIATPIDVTPEIRADFLIKTGTNLLSAFELEPYSAALFKSKEKSLSKLLRLWKKDIAEGTEKLQDSELADISRLVVSGVEFRTGMNTLSEILAKVMDVCCLVDVEIFGQDGCSNIIQTIFHTYAARSSTQVSQQMTCSQAGVGGLVDSQIISQLLSLASETHGNCSYSPEDVFPEFMKSLADRCKVNLSENASRTNAGLAALLVMASLSAMKVKTLKGDYKDKQETSSNKKQKVVVAGEVQLFLGAMRDPPETTGDWLHAVGALIVGWSTEKSIRVLEETKKLISNRMHFRNQYLKKGKQYPTDLTCRLLQVMSVNILSMFVFDAFWERQDEILQLAKTKSVNPKAITQLLSWVRAFFVFSVPGGVLNERKQKVGGDSSKRKEVFSRKTRMLALTQAVLKSAHKNGLEVRKGMNFGQETSNCKFEDLTKRMEAVEVATKTLEGMTVSLVAATVREVLKNVPHAAIADSSEEKADEGTVVLERGNTSEYLETNAEQQTKTKTADASESVEENTAKRKGADDGLANQRPKKKQCLEEKAEVLTEELDPACAISYYLDRPSRSRPFHNSSAKDDETDNKKDEETGKYWTFTFIDDDDRLQMEKFFSEDIEYKVDEVGSVSGSSGVSSDSDGARERRSENLTKHGLKHVDFGVDGRELKYVSETQKLLHDGKYDAVFDADTKWIKKQKKKQKKKRKELVKAEALKLSEANHPEP